MADNISQKSFDAASKMLCIYPIDSKMSDEIQYRFGKYGEIIHQDFCFSTYHRRLVKYAFIKYRNDTSAEAAVKAENGQYFDLSPFAIRVITIHRMNVIEIDRLVQEELKPSCSDSPLHILNVLNDDCLLEIFQYFNIHQLCAIAQVCARFQYIAIKTMSNRPISVNVKYNQTDEVNVCDPKFTVNDEIFPGASWPRTAGSLFRNFGNCIKSITFNAIGATDITVYNVVPISPDLANFFNCLSNFLAKYCTNLDELTLPMDMMDHTVKRFRHTFIGLKSLKVNPGKRSIEMVRAINGCRKLSTLHLGWIPFRSTDEIVHVFKANKQIKELKIRPRSQPTTKILHIIGKYLPGLEKLEFVQFPNRRHHLNLNNDLLHLAKLNQLKVLKLDCRSFNYGIIESLFDELAGKKVPIIELELSNLAIDTNTLANGLQMIGIESLCLKCTRFYYQQQFLHMLNRMPNIKTMLIIDSSTISSFDVQSIAASLKNLTTLRCKLSGEMNEPDFLGIVDSVKSRKNQTKLLLIIEKSCSNILLVTNDIIEKNFQWLELRFELKTRNRRELFQRIRLGRFNYFENDQGW